MIQSILNLLRPPVAGVDLFYLLHDFQLEVPDGTLHAIAVEGSQEADTLSLRYEVFDHRTGRWHRLWLDLGASDSLSVAARHDQLMYCFTKLLRCQAAPVQQEAVA